MEALLQAIFLGFVEGITEFLPVSSTGHLILLVDILKFSGPPGKIFEVVIQLGSILAVCWLFRKRLWNVAITVHKESSSRHFILLLLVAFIPALLIGALAHDFIKEVLFSPKVVAVMLVVGGIVILLAEKFKPEPHYHQVEDIGIKQALFIGFMQVLAMVPGTSRSAATIIGGLFMGFDRKLAAEFSFFLAIPTMFAASVYDLYKSRHLLDAHDIGIIAVGFITAFVVALVTIRMLLAWLAKHGFVPFAIYRIIVGTLMLILLFS
ncbi:MAG: undecaprenyl-diphosphate phosphatase [Rickettsiales bacterium]